MASVLPCRRGLAASGALVLLLALAPAAAAQVPADTLLALPDPTARPGDPALPLLTLEEVTALVLAQNPTLAIARLEREIAETDAVPGTVGLLPTAGLSAAQRRVPIAGGRADFDNYSLDLAASARVPLFDGFARNARLQRLRTLARVRAFDEEAITQDLLAEAFFAYFTVAQQQQLIGVRQEAVALSEERLRIAAGRRDAGAASELEVNRALVDLNADRAALLRQEAALLQTKARLNRVLNRAEDPAFRVEDAILVDPTLVEDALEADALTASPDLLAVEASREAAELERTAVRRELWPNVDLQLGYAFSQFTDPLLPPGQTGGLSYGLTATFDLFDGFDRRRRLEGAGLRVRQQALAAERTRTLLQTSIASAYALYARSLELVALEEDNVAAARRNAAVALERFRLGASTSLELREVQRALVDAEGRLVTARFEAKATEVDLRALAGRLPG
jgi:outer membrane protein